MLIATHDGSFHADEVFAVAALGLLHPDLRVIRTRDPAKMAEADMRVDVGFRYDAEAGCFDHHQRDFAEVRPNGVRLASFGLIWRHFGLEISGGVPEVAAAMDASLVQTVDANDTGQSLVRPLVDGAHPLSLSGVIGAFNGAWDEELTPEQSHERFLAAVALAQGVLERERASSAAGHRARQIVREAIASAADPRIVELPVNAPWKQVLVPEAPEALLVIYPKRQGYGLETVPRELGSFENRRDLPDSWAGREGEDLTEITGVPDVLFAHGKRFLAVARTHEAITRLAQLALEHQ